MRAINESKNRQRCAAIRKWHGQHRYVGHVGEANLHMVAALIGTDILLQAGVGIDLLATIHVSHVIERHRRIVVGHLARLRRKQRLREQEHQNDEPA